MAPSPKGDAEVSNDNDTAARKFVSTLSEGAGPSYTRKLPAHLWVIHGAYYDFAPFLARHPGGDEMLRLGRGRDCTELFQSQHALSSIAVNQLLHKYKVEKPADAPEAPEDIFSWADNGFYATLRKEVKRHFDEKKLSWHATWGYWAKIATMISIWAVATFYMFSELSHPYLNIAAAVLAGSIQAMLGFCIMHDASHAAVSKRPWINRLMHTLWNDWNLWSHFVWLRHHVYGHHSYTGVMHRDPDIVNIMVFVRKHPKNRFRSWFKFQGGLGLFMLTTFPNQHLGQALMYAISWGIKTIFLVPLENCPKDELLISVAIYISTILFHFVLPFYLLPVAVVLPAIIAYWATIGLFYFLNVSPNHDGIKTHNNLHALEKLEANGATQYGIVTTKKDGSQVYKRDWGVQQVVGSADHTVGGGLWSTIVTQFWGGMNYQIEHHLFPTVSHAHYADIAPIVQRVCAEYQVPYVKHSWFTALWEFYQLLSWLSHKETPYPIRPDRSAKIDSTQQLAQKGE